MPTHSPRASVTAVLALMTLAILATFAVPVSAGGNDDGVRGNSGTIKVHDNATADPATRNEPHVDCVDFWVEGFNMAVDGGALDFYSWPPTGNMTLVLSTNWTADNATPEFHFLAGAFSLPAGHYRVEAEDAPGHVKSKMFWVECEENPPAQECPEDLNLEALPDGSILLTWDAAEGSDATNIYRAVGGSDFTYLATTDGEEYLDNTTTAGLTYEYTVTGLYGDQETTGCPMATTTAIPNFPSIAAAGLALAGGALGYAFFARRKD